MSIIEMLSIPVTMPAWLILAILAPDALVSVIKAQKRESKTRNNENED